MEWNKRESEEKNKIRSEPSGNVRESVRDFPSSLSKVSLLLGELTKGLLLAVKALEIKLLVGLLGEADHIEDLSPAHVPVARSRVQGSGKR
jgi:hypothetical protein